jgi:hypothetical protein
MVELNDEFLSGDMFVLWIAVQDVQRLGGLQRQDVGQEHAVPLVEIDHARLAWPRGLVSPGILGGDLVFQEYHDVLDAAALADHHRLTQHLLAARCAHLGVLVHTKRQSGGRLAVDRDPPTQRRPAGGLLSRRGSRGQRSRGHTIETGAQFLGPCQVRRPVGRQLPLATQRCQRSPQRQQPC